MKNKSLETFKIKLSNWHYKICIDNNWVNCGLIESKGYPSLALPPQISELQKVLPGYTYTTSRDSLWHIFAPHTTDDGAGDGLEFSIDLLAPSDQSNLESSDTLTSDQSNLESSDTLTEVITFKIYGGTTYYSFDGSGNDWENCQVQTGKDPIVPPPIATIQSLNKNYAYYSYQSLSDAEKKFAAHQGSGLGDGESFSIAFNAELETVTIHWMVTLSYPLECPDVLEQRIGRYMVKNRTNDWADAGCVQYGKPDGRLFYWVLAPTNNILSQNPVTSNLYFTDEQYSKANPIFWSQSGSSLTGMSEDFSIEMSRIRTK
jgi:hypothetical protein